SAALPDVKGKDSTGPDTWVLRERERAGTGAVPFYPSVHPGKAGRAAGHPESGPWRGRPCGQEKRRMARWLFKEEPDHYSFADLQRDGTALWDGVSNNLARQHLRNVRKGDRVFFYHTGKEKAIVGEMHAVADAETDPDGDDPKAVVVRVKP